MARTTGNNVHTVAKSTEKRGNWPKSATDKIATTLRAQLAKYKGANGVMMDSSSWKVTALIPASQNHKRLLLGH